VAKTISYKLLLTDDQLITLKGAVENQLGTFCPPGTPIIEQETTLANVHPDSHIGKLLTIKEALRRAFHGAHSPMIEVQRG
jgi:hypothetical protein